MIDIKTKQNKMVVFMTGKSEATPRVHAVIFRVSVAVTLGLPKYLVYQDDTVSIIWGFWNKIWGVLREGLYEAYGK